MLSRVPITAKLVADLITAAGASRVLAMDLHAGQIQGFFNIPVDHLFAAPVSSIDYLRARRTSETPSSSRPTRAASSGPAPSPSGSTPASAIIDKRRDGPNVAVFMNLIGDVKGKDVVIIDDMIDTAGTLIQAVEAVKREGARRVLACAVHGVLSGPAIERIAGSALEEVVITNSIPLPRGEALPRRSTCCRWRRCSRRPSAASTTRSRSRPSSCNSAMKERRVMEIRELTIQPREGVGKCVARRLRRSGKTPASSTGARLPSTSPWTRGKSSASSTATRAARSCST